MTFINRTAFTDLSPQVISTQDINAGQTEQDLLHSLLLSPMEINMDALLTGVSVNDSITIRSLRSNGAALTIQKTGENDIKLNFSIPGGRTSGVGLRVNYDGKEMVLSPDGQGYAASLKNSELPALLRAQLKEVSKVSPRELGSVLAAEAV